MLLGGKLVGRGFWSYFVVRLVRLFSYINIQNVAVHSGAVIKFKSTGFCVLVEQEMNIRIFSLAFVEGLLKTAPHIPVGLL